MKNFKKTFIALFYILVFIVPAILLLTPDKTFSNEENRLLAQRPELSLESIFSGQFMDDLEEYINDQFILRDKWVSVSTHIRRALGQSDIKNVIIQDGKLFNKRDNLSQKEQEQLDKNIQSVQKFMNNNPNCYFGLIPTAVDVYNINYPTKLNQKELIDSIYGQTNGQTVDFYGNLSNHKEEYIYYNTDHHWTTLGAYYGYEAIGNVLNFVPTDKKDFVVENISTEFLGTTQSKINIPFDKENIEVWVKDDGYIRIVNGVDEYDTLYDVSKLTTKEQYAVFLGGNNGNIVIKNPNTTSDKKLLLVKDSYSHCLAPFLLSEYAEITLMDLRYSGITTTQTVVDNGNFDDIIIMYNIENFISDKQILFLNNFN